jgi:hypothetical protein
MRALPRLFLACVHLMIFGFCVYGFLVTFRIPGESFCRATYGSLIILSGLCVTQIVAPAWQSRPTQIDSSPSMQSRSQSI